MIRFWRIDGTACWFWAAALLVIPLRWLGAAFLAAGVHEFFHAAAAILMGGRILSLRIRALGCSMEIDGLGHLGEGICALAGPLGSFMLICFCHVLPYTAVCGLFQGLFNLLPVYPLDGGRAVRCLLEGISARNAGRITDWIGLTVLGFLMSLAVMVSAEFLLLVCILFVRIYILRKMT